MEQAGVACICRRHTHVLLTVYQSAYNIEVTEQFIMVTQSGIGCGHFDHLQSLSASAASWEDLCTALTRHANSG